MKLPTALAPFKRELKKLHSIELNLFRELLNNVRKRMKDGKAPPCWERSFIEEKEKLGLSDDEGAYVIGTLYEAGSSTTAAAMMNVLLALVHYPAWQTRLQEEVDQVVGDSRMPVFEDIERLPVVRAVAKEALRWRPVSAGGIPHQLDKDDVYDGIFFPKGTNVHANQW
jgi:cytochrome P450